MLLAPLCDHKAGDFALPLPETRGMCRSLCQPGNPGCLGAGASARCCSRCAGLGVMGTGVVAPGACQCRELSWSQSKHQAWENTVSRWLGTAGTALRGPCVCIQPAEALCRGCLSPHPGRGDGWVGASQAPSLPRPAMTGEGGGGSSGERLGGGRAHSSLDCRLSPNPASSWLDAQPKLLIEGRPLLGGLGYAARRGGGCSL